MPPDPTVVHSLAFSDVGSVDEERSKRPDWYDRSSLAGEFMVMIAGQTEDDYLRHAPDRQFCEFIDGIVYMPPRVHADHQEDVNRLLFFIMYYHTLRPVGYLSSGPAAIKLRDGCWLEPDLFLVPEAARTQVKRDGFARPPVLLAVEVLSPSHRDHDLVTKAALYREARVDEVWFVDRPNRVVLVDRREGDVYHSERVEAGPVISRSLAGFWFDPGWLWAEPEPNLIDCIQQVLAGPPPG